MSQDLDPGLYIVATPIGNLSDISLRAIEVLGRVDVVACEDSRVTGKLLHHLGIKKPMIRYDDHSKPADRARLIDMMRDKSVALVSDAGTPLISDPGYKLVRDARDAALAITSVPGANAAIVALTLSGLPTDRFYFHGFLPPKSAARVREIGALKSLPATLIFYESGPRLAAMLADLASVFGDRDAAVAREISKRFEEVRTGTLEDLAAGYETPPKGEIVVIVAAPGDDEAQPDDADIAAALDAALKDFPPGKAASLVAKRFGVDRKPIYERALALRKHGT